MEVFEQISDKVCSAAIPPRILLSRFRFIDDTSRYSRECLDPRYLPFYYFLGRAVPADALLEVGFGLGLAAACYFTGSPGTEHYLTAQEPVGQYYSKRLGVSNVKQVWRKPFHVHLGAMHDEDFVGRLRGRKWDVVIMNDKKEYDTHMLWLNMVWEEVKLGGMIFMDYTTLHEQARRSYHDFCLVKHREPYVFPTRYGVGAIVR